jgi:hypothetical protein
MIYVGCGRGTATSFLSLMTDIGRERGTLLPLPHSITHLVMKICRVFLKAKAGGVDNLCFASLISVLTQLAIQAWRENRIPSLGLGMHANGPKDLNGFACAL